MVAPDGSSTGPDAGGPAPVAQSPGPVTSDGVPARLGAWTVTGRWHGQESGQVLAGRGPAGEAELVVLGAAPALDAAARDRFAAAVDELRRTHPDRVVDADASGAVPWAALRPGSGPDGARPLLDAPLHGLAPGDDGRRRGPGFSPYWSGVPARYPAPAPPGVRGRRRWWWWVVVAAVLLLLLLLLASCWPRDDGGGQGPQPTPPATDSPTPSESPSDGPPTPSESPSDGPGGPTRGPSGSPSPPPGSEA